MKSMDNMKELIERNYKSIVKRGLITPSLIFKAFFNKIDEEVQELKDAENMYQLKEELADVILVCLNLARHYDIDIEDELNKKISINEQRKD